MDKSLSKQEKIQSGTSKKGTGRPTDYKPEYCDTLIKHMTNGLSFESFAGTIDQTRSTLYNWLDKFPEFMDAKKKGVEKALLFWEKLGRAIAASDVTYIQKAFNVAPFLKKEVTKTYKDGTTEYTREWFIPQGDTGTWVFNMKNRFGWRDIQDIKHSVDERVTKFKVEIVRNGRAKHNHKTTK